MPLFLKGSNRLHRHTLIYWQHALHFPENSFSLSAHSRLKHTAYVYNVTANAVEHYKRDKVCNSIRIPDPNNGNSRLFVSESRICLAWQR